MKPDNMHNFVEEWQRIFLRLRALPCTADISRLRSHTRGDYMIDGLDDNITEDSDEEMTEDSDDNMTEDSEDDITEDSDDDITEDSEDDMTKDSYEGMTEDLDGDELGSNRLNFRIKLWRTLGYREGHLIQEGFEHIWQTNMETKIIGWPVVPISVFHDPGPYSTTANWLCDSRRQ